VKKKKPQIFSGGLFYLAPTFVIYGNIPDSVMNKTEQIKNSVLKHPVALLQLKLVLHNTSTTQQIVVPSFLYFYLRHNMFRSQLVCAKIAHAVV
jgi:hypothetical protein